MTKRYVVLLSTLLCVSACKESGGGPGDDPGTVSNPDLTTPPAASDPVLSILAAPGTASYGNASIFTFLVSATAPVAGLSTFSSNASLAFALETVGATVACVEGCTIDDDQVLASVGTEFSISFTPNRVGTGRMSLVGPGLEFYKEVEIAAQATPAVKILLDLPMTPTTDTCVQLVPRSELLRHTLQNKLLFSRSANVRLFSDDACENELGLAADGTTRLNSFDWEIPADRLASITEGSNAISMGIMVTDLGLAEVELQHEVLPGIGQLRFYAYDGSTDFGGISMATDSMSFATGACTAASLSRNAAGPATAALDLQLGLDYFTDAACTQRTTVAAFADQESSMTIYLKFYEPGYRYISLPTRNGFTGSQAFFDISLGTGDTASYRVALVNGDPNAGGTLTFEAQTADGARLEGGMPYPIWYSLMGEGGLACACGSGIPFGSNPTIDVSVGIDGSYDPTAPDLEDPYHVAYGIWFGIGGVYGEMPVAP